MAPSTLTGAWLLFIRAWCVKSVGHQGALATSGLCQVGGEAEERPVHCGSLLGHEGGSGVEAQGAACHGLEGVVDAL